MSRQKTDHFPDARKKKQRASRQTASQFEKCLKKISSDGNRFEYAVILFECFKVIVDGCRVGGGCLELVPRCAHCAISYRGRKGVNSSHSAPPSNHSATKQAAKRSTRNR